MIASEQRIIEPCYIYTYREIQNSGDYTNPKVITSRWICYVRLNYEVTNVFLCFKILSMHITLMLYVFEMLLFSLATEFSVVFTGVINSRGVIVAISVLSCMFTVVLFFRGLNGIVLLLCWKYICFRKFDKKKESYVKFLLVTVYLCFFGYKYAMRLLCDQWKVTCNVPHWFVRCWLDMNA